MRFTHSRSSVAYHLAVRNFPAHFSVEFLSKILELVSQVPESHLAECAVPYGGPQATISEDAAAPTSTVSAQVAGIHSDIKLLSPCPSGIILLSPCHAGIMLLLLPPCCSDIMLLSPCPSGIILLSPCHSGIMQLLPPCHAVCAALVRVHLWPDWWNGYSDRGSVIVAVNPTANTACGESASTCSD